NNAGGSNLSPIHDFHVAERSLIVTLNLTGVFHRLKATAPLLLANRRLPHGGGAVLGTASVPGSRPAARQAPHPARDAGGPRLTASAALEYGPKIRVNAVSPGMIATGLTSPLLAMDRAVPHMTAKTPLARIGTPEDIADVVCFLCSDLSRFITGQNLVIDGG